MFRTLLFLLITVSVPPTPVQQPLSTDAASAVVKETVRLVRQNYVFSDKADGVVQSIEQHLAARRYSVADAQLLATRLTEDLQAVTRDKHMNVKFNPEQATALRGPRSGGDADAFRLQQMASSNYGIPELKVLPGNVRYINISPGFLWDPARSPQAFDDAMRFLAGGDAYIIDIRTNGGGSPATVRYVVSHFMDAGQKLMTYRIGPEGTSESRTQAVPAGKLAAKPLYLLTSPKSASAAEEFASHIKNFKLGTLVGGTTAGAGHRNALFGTPEGFVISVSVGTAIHPVTRKVELQRTLDSLTIKKG
jgi:TolA-binding protein